MMQSSLMLAVALAVAATAGSAATVPAQQDAFVRQGAPNTVHNDPELFVKGEFSGPDWRRRALMKFDLSSATGFAGSTLSLSLSVRTNAATTVQVYAMSDARGDNWSESTLTFNNAPAFGATGTTGTTLLGSFVVANGTAAGTTFTFGGAALETFLATGAGADELVTLGLYAINNTTDQILKFHSSETATPALAPSLSVGTVPLPAPVALMAAGVGALALLRRRRRRG
jgi:hypothetical protein